MTALYVVSHERLSGMSVSHMQPFNISEIADRRARAQAGQPQLRRASEPAARRAGKRLPLRDRLVGAEGALGRRALPRPARARRSAPHCEGDPLSLAGGPL